jgi:parvulin-like peptidyl-prolyl isomerase
LKAFILKIQEENVHLKKGEVKMKKSWFFLFLFLAFLIFLSCAKKDQRLVATIGEDKITVDEFNLKLGNRVRSLPPTRTEELNMRMSLLDRFIQEKLLAEASIELGKDKQESFINAVKEQEERLLLQELFTKEVMDKSVPTERELKDFYEKQGEEIHARHILVKDKAKAEEIYKKLQEGADFEELAKQETEDVATKDRGGDLGFFQWGRMVGPFQEAAFKLKPQEISKPVKSGFGWHIIKVEERRELEQPEYETIKENLNTALQRYKQQELSQTFVEDMRRKSDFKVNSKALQVLMDKAEKKEDTLEVKTSKGAEFNPAAFSPEDRDLSLANFKGGELKLGEFVDNYQQLPPFRRPGLDERLLEDLVYQMSLKPILLKTARDEKIDKSQGFLDKLKDFKEMTLAEEYKYTVLWKDISATEEEIQEYYEKNKDLYLDPAKVKVREIMVKTEEEAKEVLKQVKEGADWEKLAKEKTLRAHVKHRGGELGFVGERVYPEIFDYAWNKMKVGEIGGPVHIKQSRYGEGYSVIELLDKKYSYQKHLRDVETDVQKRVIGDKKLKILEDWTNEKKEGKKVEIFEEVLESTVEAKE